MAISGDVLRECLPEVVGEFHVLAVDDSHVDRKVIERLLKFTSCKGIFHNLLCFSSVFGSSWIIFWTVIEFFVVVVVVAVTVVESGTRALQYLGLDGNTSSIGFDVSKFWIFCFRNLLYIVLFEVFMWLFWWIWLQGVKVNMIMTDYSMPGMTGYELLKKIKVCVLFFEF